jgi:hypothetical protein
LDLDLVPNPDPLVRGLDPGIRIRTKMSRIPNTEIYDYLLISVKDVQATGEASSFHKRKIQHFKIMKFLPFFFFVCFSALPVSDPGSS